MMDGPSYTKANEGLRLTAYQDQGGVWTCGYGCTGPLIIEGTVWTQDEADQMFQMRYDLAMRGAATIMGDAWDVLNDARKAALTDMVYQMGAAGMARWAILRMSLVTQKWAAARDATLASLYAQQQAPARAKRNATIFLTGQMPDEGSF